MSSHPEELRGVVEELNVCTRALKDPKLSEPIAALESAASAVAKAWSGSWIGYHANIYYEDLKARPPGAHFSSEWGMNETLGDGTRGRWSEFDPEGVKHAIIQAAGSPDLEAIRRRARDVQGPFETAKGLVVSILEVEKTGENDAFVDRLLEEASRAKFVSPSDVIAAWRPSGRIGSRDSLAVSQGLWTPPHLTLLAEVVSFRSAEAACERLAATAEKAASHLERTERRRKRGARVGTNVFIGHGRSLLWKDLKDFVQDRLRLPWDEFNRVPIAGVTNIARLAEMLDAAAMAFLVLTGEDETKDGTTRARMNVVHEAGLFQGRLGFTRAIVLVEDGCEEFSNIQGLGQIRFPKGNIKAAFEEVRLVLEREGVLEAVGPT
jgi:predicted nucleotide-binding protein